jgi:pyruvate formate lyase activating enzyme
MSEVKGIVFDIRRYSTHDGPGIRTTVFLKGCPLRCCWCHNPESQECEPFRISKKVRIGTTILTMEDWCGRKMTVREVLEEAERDRPFYEESGGGVTFSGGEPFLQPEFLLAALRECRRRSLHTCVDTCGYVDFQLLQDITPWIDLFLFDLKIIDSASHRLHTGEDNEVILRNLRHLLADKRTVTVRFPLIPGYTDDRDNIDQIATLILNINNSTEISVLPYHSMSEDKYRRLGKTSIRIPGQSPSQEQIDRVVERFHRLGLKVKVGG